MPQKFLLTGRQGAGKSTLALAIVDALGVPAHGFLTLPYTINGQVKGHYFHSLPPVEGMENDLPINVRTGAQSCIALPEVFATLGVACLTQTLQSKAPLVLLDEIGRIEREQTAYLALLEQIFARDGLVLAVGKKEPLPHLQTLCNRADVQVFDLDNTPAEQVKQQILDNYRCYL